MALFDGLISCWKFDRDSTTQKDSGPAAQHGAVTGSISSVTSLMGKGLQFTQDAGKYIHLPSNQNNEIWQGCTVGWVVRIDSYANPGGNGSIFSKTDANPNWHCGLRVGGGGLHFSEGGANKFTNLQTVVPADGNFHFIMLTASAANPAVLKMYVDGVQIGTDGNPGSSTATTGYKLFAGSHNLRIGAPEQAFFGSGSTAAVFTIDEALIWNRVLTLSEHQSWYNSAAGTPLPQTGITLDEVGQWKVYQRDKGGSNTCSITRSGHYTTGTPTTIEFAAYDYTDGVTVVQDWTPMTNTTISGGDWTGTVRIPLHTNWCKFKVRSKDAGGTVLETSELSLGCVGVGAIFLCAGQSNMAHHFDWYTTTFANAKTAVYYSSLGWTHSLPNDGSQWDYIGAGANVLMDKIQQTLDCPVGLIHTAIGGTALTNTGVDYWLNLAGTVYPACLAALAAAGGDVEGILWHQGEADAEGSVSAATYKAGLDTLYSRLQSAVGRTADELSFGCGSLGNLNVTTDANVSNIRNAQLQWAEETEGAYYLGSAIDITRAPADNYHWNQASCERVAKRYAQSILHNLGLTNVSGAGPFVDSVCRIPGTTVVVASVNLNGSDRLLEVDGSIIGDGVTGFELTDDAFSTTLTISSILFAGSRIHFVLSAAPADEDTVQLRYQYGKQPTITNPVYTNYLPQGDTLGLPLQSTSQNLTAALKTPIYMI